MGCDGGSIPKRHELVKTKKKDEVPDKQAVTDATWKCCALSKEPLREPVVACRLGRLYNKEKLIEFLLSKATNESSMFGDAAVIAGHITSLKDVVTLKLTGNPAASAKEPTTSAIVSSFNDKPVPSNWICPVTLKEMNGRYKFSFIATCGCVVSHEALSQVPTKSCLSCAKPFEPSTDIIPINATDPTELEALKTKMEAWKHQQVMAKKAKKSNKASKTSAASTATSGEVETAAVKAPRKHKASDDDDDDDLDEDARERIKRRATASATVNIPLPPELKRLAAGAPSVATSEAIKSMYASASKNADDKKKGNYLTMGTFTRYAAF